MKIEASCFPEELSFISDNIKKSIKNFDSSITKCIVTVKCNSDNITTSKIVYSNNVYTLDIKPKLKLFDIIGFTYKFACGLDSPTLCYPIYIKNKSTKTSYKHKYIK